MHGVSGQWQDAIRTRAGLAQDRPQRAFSSARRVAEPGPCIFHRCGTAVDWVASIPQTRTPLNAAALLVAGALLGW
jgi:hypothetical protein